MLLSVTGHRPDKLGGYNPLNPLRVRISQAMREALVRLAPEKTFSGMALGIDQDFASLCVELGIPFVAAVPFLGQESRWPDESQRIYYTLLGQATEVVYVSEPGYDAWKMQVRNEWMVDQIGNAGTVMAVWDGSKGGTGNCVRYAEKLRRTIFRINPEEIAAAL